MKRTIFLQVKPFVDIWMEDFQYHRENKHPALLFNSGVKEWWHNGQMQNISDKDSIINIEHLSLDSLKSVEKFLDN